jgi:hypothetical protein
MNCDTEGLEEFCSAEKGRGHFKEIVHKLVERGEAKK